MFAKTKRVQDILIQAFKDHSVKKYYYALVYGAPKEKTQTLNHYLLKDSSNNAVKIFNNNIPGSVAITTTYTVEKMLDLFTLLKVEIYAGKTHQIRAHLAYINLPILGDEKYGNTQINKQFSKRTQQLQAYKIEFNFNKENKLNYLNNLTLKLNCEIDTNL
jgi:23S rRNA pseudouridine955/2504/2580 synthase